MAKEKKNILNRQFTTLTLYYTNKLNKIEKRKIIDTYGHLHYSNGQHESCHWEFSDYDTLVRDLDSKRCPEEILKVLFTKKKLFSKTKEVYEDSWDARKINRKSFVRLVFNQEYLESKTETLQYVMNNLPVEELFIFIREHGDDLSYLNTLSKFTKSSN